MSDPLSGSVAALPSMPALSRRDQWRWLAALGGGAVLLVLAVWLVQVLIAPRPELPPSLPPGTFRPTAEQLQAMRIELVGAPGSEQTTATGIVSLDETRATPIYLPYSGQVLGVFVEAGQRVQRGQPMARVRTTDVVDADDALRTAQAQRAAAASQVRVAAANAERAEQIYKTAGGALRDLQSAQNDLITAQAALRSADAGIAAARERLGIFGGGQDGVAIVRAPLSGTVTSRAVAPGQFVTAGGQSPLFTVADLTRLWLVAQLEEDNATRVRPGDIVSVTTPALPGRRFTATIDNVGAAIDPVTRRLPVRAVIANPDGALKPQMFASYAITRAGSQEGTTSVPATAVIHEGDVARVWVLRRDGLLQARQVQVGATVGGRVAIEAGLSRGEKIVTAGALFVNEAGLGS